jgi:hypothetical protein
MGAECRGDHPDSVHRQLIFLPMHFLCFVDARSALEEFLWRPKLQADSSAWVVFLKLLDRTLGCYSCLIGARVRPSHPAI